MAKQKERNEVSYLRAENKRLEYENRRLKKLINKKYKKGNLGEEDNQDEIYLEALEEPKGFEKLKEFDKSDNCPKCGEKLTIAGGSKIIVYLCKECKYRTSKKI